jgi:acetyl esterase/lipase
MDVSTAWTSALLLSLAFLLASCHGTIRAADQPNPPVTQPAMRLWDGDAPGALDAGDADVPTLTSFLLSPTKTNTAAFIVCPGGAYGHLAPHEGAPVARWLNSLGIQAFVLKYRIGPKYHHPVEMLDVQRAIRLVRCRARQWNLDPNRIGIAGFSAGGHLASTVATHFDDGIAADPDPINRVSCRPDLAILAYPVICMSGPYVHTLSRRNLLGDDPNPELELFLCNDRQVTAQTPPCFIIHAADDRTVPVENSLLFAMACRQHKVPVELHVFEHGPHGFGLGGNDPILATWPAIAAQWLRKHKFVTD